MKSQANESKNDQLVFLWDNKAAAALSVKTEGNNQRCLDEYFDLLTEIKPHKEELNKTALIILGGGSGQLTMS